MNRDNNFQIVSMALWKVFTLNRKYLVGKNG